MWDVCGVEKGNDNYDAPISSMSGALIDDDMGFSNPVRLVVLGVGRGFESKEAQMAGLYPYTYLVLYRQL